MDIERLHQIIAETTIQLRKGPAVVSHSLLVTEINFNPTEQEAADRLVGMQIIDLTLLSVGVDERKAQTHRDELVSILKTYRDDNAPLERGPSYIHVGATIGDQGAAFQLFALGKVLGFWEVHTPEGMGATGEEARALAGRGYVMISGFNP